MKNYGHLIKEKMISNQEITVVILTPHFTENSCPCILVLPARYFWPS